MIIIFDEFFIQISDLLIGLFLKIIDLILLCLNKFNDGDNFVNKENYEGDFKEDSKVVFGENNKNNLDYPKNDLANLSFKSRINNFFKNDSIFEELENKYFSNSSSTISNSPKKSKNIFSSINNVSNLNNLNKEINDSNSNENIDNYQNKFFVNIKEKTIRFLVNNGYDKLLNKQYNNINEFNFYSFILRIILIIFSILTMIAALISYFISLELGLAILLLFALIAFGILYYPKIKKQNDYSSFSKELPYALRQLVTELRSGKSLFDSLDSIASSDYEVLSLEFSRVLEEIKYGESTENAFLNLEKRVNSQALSRVIYEILTSLRVGANLSSSLSIIAEDINFDIRMKLKEHGEKLNAFIMIYTFLAILAPVILLTILLASSVIIGDLVPSDLILILYSLFFPMIIVFLGFAIKKLEPKI